MSAHKNTLIKLTLSLHVEIYYLQEELHTQVPALETIFNIIKHRICLNITHMLSYRQLKKNNLQAIGPSSAIKSQLEEKPLKIFLNEEHFINFFIYSYQYAVLPIATKQFC